MTPDLAAVVLAGGLGTRMRSSRQKHAHELLGRRMVDWVIETARALEPDRLVVVASPETRDAYEDVDVAVQEEPRGTGDAAAAALGALDGFDGDVLVLADTPMLTPELLQGLIDEHRREDADVTVLSFEPVSPQPYGRVLRDDSGAVTAIVEEKDAGPDQLAVTELNSSIYVFRAPALRHALAKLDSDNAQRELYLTDTIEHVIAGGGKAAAYLSPDPVAVVGVNTRADLALAAGVLRRRVNEAHMLAGVTIVDPETTWIDAAVELEPDSTIHPFTVLRGRTKVAAGAEIGPQVVAVDAEIGPDTTTGPFCYLRPGTVLGPRVKAGTFVEIKNSQIGDDAKVPHLSYIGDAEIGAGTNIGASNVTANFDHRPGQPKKRTKIGRNVRTAVDNTFVAPVEIGDDAWLAAGTVITEDVPPGSLAGFPPRQVTKEGYVYDKYGKRDNDSD